VHSVAAAALRSPKPLDGREVKDMQPLSDGTMRLLLLVIILLQFLPHA
jgi:predicted ATPase